MAVRPPADTHYSSILQLVSSSYPIPVHQIDFESMEDIKDLARCVAGSTEHVSDSSPPTSAVGSTPLLRTTSSPSTSGSSPGALAPLKEKRSSLHNIDHDILADSPATPLPRIPMRSTSLNALIAISRSQQEQEMQPGVGETNVTLPIPLGAPTHSSAKTRHSIHGANSYGRRQSLEISRTPSGTRRVKRIPSMWISRATDDPTAIRNTVAEDQSLRTEPRLSEEQKLIALKRVRKIAQVFGNEAPTELIQGLDHPSCPSAISSADIPPQFVTRKRRSSSALSATSDQTLTSPDIANGDASSSPPSSPIAESPLITFRERRRRAAKLIQFFGVDYHDIPQSVSHTHSSPAKTVDNVTPTSPAAPQSPLVEVNVKVTKQRLWGLVDDEMKNADVSDVIKKLRVLKAA